MLRLVQGLFGGKVSLCSRDGLWFDIAIQLLELNRQLDSRFVQGGRAHF